MGAGVTKATRTRGQSDLKAVHQREREREREREVFTAEK